MRRRKFNKKRQDLGRFKSPLEKEIYDKLVRVKNKKFNFQYEGEKLKYFTVHDYSPDIVLTFPGGKKIYIEIKGYLRYEDQRKMRAVKEANPDLDIRFIFTDRSRVAKSKMSPAQWAKKYGFECTILGEVPKEWIKSQQQQQPRSAESAKKRNRLKTSTDIDKIKMEETSIANSV